MPSVELCTINGVTYYGSPDCLHVPAPVKPEPTAYDVRRSCEAPLETSDWRWLTCSCGGRLAGCLDNAEEAV